MIGLEQETLIFLYAMATGVIAKCVYDMLDLFRRIIRHPGWLMGAEDIIYWLCMSVYIFRALFFTTYGRVRWFFLLGLMCGVLLERFIRKWIKKFLIK